MTRDQAFERVRAILHSGTSERFVHDFVDSLIALEVFKPETVDAVVRDKAAMAAAWVLTARRIDLNAAGLVSKDGAYEIIDILRRRGFKIVAPEV